eukprot:91004_1
MPKRGSKNKNKRSSNKNKHKNNKQNQYKHDPPPPNPSILQHSIPKTKAMQLKEKGNNEFVNLNFKKAIHFYTKGIELEPNNHTLYSNRSVAYLKLNKYELALKDANKCIELQPDWHKGYVTFQYNENGNNTFLPFNLSYPARKSALVIVNA